PWSLSLRSSLQTLSLHLNRLVFAAQRPLLQSNLTWLKRFTSSLAPRAEQNQPGEGPADGPRLQLDLRITSSDCLLDVPSESLGSAWPVTSPQGLAVPMPPPKDRGTDSDKWRLVLHVSHAGAVLRGSEGQAPWLQLNLAMLGAYLSDHPANLTQLELLADATDPNEFLPAVGFAPFMEMSSASASFLGLPQEDASAEAQRRE
ncbi:Ethe1, partial [Symbiodinium natans]